MSEMTVSLDSVRMGILSMSIVRMSIIKTSIVRMSPTRMSIVHSCGVQCLLCYEQLQSVG